MTWEETFRLIGTGLFSVSSAGAIIVGLSSWLGKIWAQRILQKESHELKIQLNAAQHELNVSLKTIEKELDLMKEKYVSIRNDKVLIYRGIIDLIASLLAKLDAYYMNRLSQDEAMKHFDVFNEQRIRLYGYMAMFAPQNVMDTQDELIDHLLQVAYGKRSYEWEEIRTMALALINEIREDVGIDQTPIEYNGKL
ncbi:MULTISPECIES: hypothetical protein [Pectobacterium]|uniref:hypothetical protein n=1 Tax=Pectobacterium TaxID=122277 RepID=UPI001968F306|nr:hypothetical protein [Pectobacterium brasiliense]MBN3054990.1 hypothetical protein [Pectobacterium brasiliense]